MALIQDENHPEMQRALRELVGHLKILATVRPHVDREFYRQLLEARDEHRIRWRLRGLDFPHLVVFGVPRLGPAAVELWREDLDLPNIRVKLVNFVRLHHEATAQELGTALQAAYSWLRPGDLLQTVINPNTSAVH